MADETINLSHSDDEDDIQIISSTGKPIAIDEDDLESIYLLFKNIITDSQWLKGEPFPYEYLHQISQLVKKFRNIRSYDFVIKSIFKIKLNLGTQSKELKCDFERLNLILSDIMASYIDFKSSSLAQDIFEKKISSKTRDYECNSVLQKLFIIFNSDMIPITLTLLKCNATVMNAPFLYKIFEKILSNKHYHKHCVNDFLAYLRLLLCYKHWKQLFTSNMMECKKKVNDIARKILPKDIPVYVPIRVSDREPDITIQFRKILPKLTTVKMKKATKNLLNYTGCDTNSLNRDFLELYGKKISYVEVPSQVKLKPKNKTKVQNNENVTCKNSIPIQIKAKRTAIKQQSSSNIKNSLIQRNLVSNQSKNEVNVNLNLNLNIRNYKGNVNINYYSEYSKEEFNDIIEISDEDVPNKPKIECNKRKILVPKSCNDEPILKHSKIEKTNISCKPISLLLDKNNSNESHLVDSGLLSSEIKTNDVFNVLESSTNHPKLSCKTVSKVDNKRNSINEIESNSKIDKKLTKIYTSESSEHNLNLHLFDEPPQVTRVYAKVASHPDIIYTNTSQPKDGPNYASVPTNKVIFSMSKPYVKKSHIHIPTTSNLYLQKGSNSIDRSLIGIVNVIPDKHFEKSKSNNKQTSVLKTIDEKSALLTNLESSTTSELLHSIVESVDEKSKILKAESNDIKIEGSCLEAVKNNVNSQEDIEIKKNEQITSQNVKIHKTSMHSCSNIIKPRKIALKDKEISIFQETIRNNLNQICESSLAGTETSLIIDRSTDKITSELNKTSANATEDVKETFDSTDKVSLDTIPSEAIKSNINFTEKVQMDTNNFKQISATGKTNSSSNNTINKLNVDPTTQSKEITKEPITLETKNELNQPISNVKEPEKQLLQLQTTLSTDHKLIQNTNFESSQAVENFPVKVVGTTGEKNVKKTLKSIQILTNFGTKEEIKSKQPIPCAKDSSPKVSYQKNTENGTSEQIKSKEISDHSKARQCNQSDTTQEEFMLTVQLKPVFPRILPKDNLTKNHCTEKIENICLKLEAKFVKNKSKFTFTNRKIQQPEEKSDEHPKDKFSKNECFKSQKIIEHFEPKNTSEDKKLVDVEHNINMLASVALTSGVLEAEESQKCKKVRKLVTDESLLNLAPIRLTRNSSNKYDKDEVNEDFVKATNTNVIKVKRKSSVDSKICNTSKKVKEHINERKSENENKSKFNIDSMLETKVTNNGNKSIDNLAMVLWEKKNIKSPEWFDSTIFNLNKIDKETVTSTPKQISLRPEILNKNVDNCREIKEEENSIDDKIKMRCSVIIEDLVRKNVDEKNDSEVLLDDDDNVLSKNFNFDANISSFVCNRLNLDTILDTPSKESEMNFSLDKITNGDKMKDETENVKEIELSVSSNSEHNRKEANSEFSVLDFYSWYNILPSPTLLKDDQLGCEFSETLDLEDLINSQSDNISSTNNTLFSGDRLISGNNEYILSKQVGHTNNACNPFNFSTTSDFFELEYSQHNSPEQSSNENTNNELINEIFYSNAETQQTPTNSLQLNPNEFLNLATESVIQKLESSTTNESPDLDVISLEEMKIMSTENILNKSIRMPSVEELKKQINENIEKKKITEKHDTPSKLSRRMHKIPSGTSNKKIKLLTKVEEENISKIKSSDSDDRNLSFVFSNNGSLPSLIDDDLMPPSYDLKDKIPITVKPNLVRKLFNTQSLPPEKKTESKKIDYSEIFNKLKSEERNETQSLPKVQLTKNSLIPLRDHDESASKRKQKYDKFESSSSVSTPIAKQANNFFENPKNVNVSNVNNLSDNKIKLSTFRHPKIVEDNGLKCNKQLNSNNRRKTDPNETHSNIKLSDSKLHSQSSNSISHRSKTPPFKKKPHVYAMIGADLKKYCLEKIATEKIIAGKKWPEPI